MGMVAGESSGRQLAPKVIDLISTRLGEVATLRVPGQMKRGTGEVSAEERCRYLSGLLTHDPGVFLERHGDQLTADERAFFHPLRKENFEVDFYLRALEAQAERPASANRGKVSVQVKNRRVAALHALVEAGDHFSDEAMRHREPYLYHLYVGQYKEDQPQQQQDLDEGDAGGEGGAERGTVAADGSVLSTTLAASLMARQEEFDLMVRREGEREGWAMAEEESEEEEESEDDVDRAAPGRELGALGIGGREQGPEGGDVAWWGAGTAVSEEERQGNYDAFLDIMHQKFLNGDDKGADYAAIDNDASLDFSREAQHDAEDAYFGE